MANKKDIDMNFVLDLLEEGESPADIAEAIDVSEVLLQRHIKDMQDKQGLILQYRALQSFQLTELQAKIISAITPENIEDATFAQKVRALEILKKLEMSIEKPKAGSGGQLKGLIAHLTFLEQQERALTATPIDGESFSVEAVSDVR